MTLFFVMFRLIVLMPNSMSKLIHNRCTCKLNIKTTAACMYVNEQFRLCFYVFVRYLIYFVALDIHL